MSATPPTGARRALFSPPAAPLTSAPASGTLVYSIREALPLADYASRFVKLEPAGRELKGRCPFHEDDTPSFYISPSKGVYNCHGCGASGNVIHFHANIKDMAYDQAKRELATELGLISRNPLSPELQVLADAARTYASCLTRDPTSDKTPGTGEAQTYLHERGLSPGTIARFGIGYCPPGAPQPGGRTATLTLRAAGLVSESGRNLMTGRITFPIRNVDGQVVAFGGRQLVSAEQNPENRSPKYMNTGESANFRKSEILFGLYESRPGMRREGCAVIVEGYMDVAVLHGHGLDNTVAVMGATAGERAFEPLWAATRRVVFCMDGDRAGQAGALRSVMNAARTMKDGCVIGVVELPAGMDPDEFVLAHGADAFRERCRTATPLTEFLCRTELAKLGGVDALATAESRAAFRLGMDQVAEAFVAAPILREEIARQAEAVCMTEVMGAAAGIAGVGASTAELEQAIAVLEELKRERAVCAPAIPDAQPEGARPATRNRP